MGFSSISLTGEIYQGLWILFDDLIGDYAQKVLNYLIEIYQTQRHV